MKQFLFTITYLFFFIPSGIYAGSTIIKKLTVPNASYNEWGFSVAADQQKNIYVVGLVEAQSVAFQNAYVMKLDSELNQVWCYTYSTGYTSFTSIKPTNDGGFLLVGTNQSSITGGQANLVV